MPVTNHFINILLLVLCISEELAEQGSRAEPACHVQVSDMTYIKCFPTELDTNVLQSFLCVYIHI